MTHFAKRHYEAIATAMQEAIKFDATCSSEVAGIYKAINALADTFARDNGQFKRDRFIRACEPGANVRARKAPAFMLVKYEPTDA
jgi:hypothetical protein